jgi:hypothetical protein
VCDELNCIFLSSPKLILGRAGVQQGDTAPSNFLLGNTLPVLRLSVVTKEIPVAAVVFVRFANLQDGRQKFVIDYATTVPPSVV